MTMSDRPKLIHLLLIGLGLAALAAGALYYTNATEPVEGLSGLAEPPVAAAPETPEACAAAGGVWNECASPCPPDAQACAQVCVRKCEGIGDGKKILDVYFPNSKLDPKHLDCAKVFPVKRAVAPAAGEFGAMEAQVAALLKGPTDAEKAAGYFTTIPDGVTLEDASNVGSDGPGVYRLVFSPELDRNVGGSCRVTAIRAQIERTVAPDGTETLIIAQGKTAETTLQP